MNQEVTTEVERLRQRVAELEAHIDERTRMVDYLRQEATPGNAESKYRRLHESMMDAFVSVDVQGRITETNPAYRTMLGYTEYELQHLTYMDVTPAKWHAFEARITAEQLLVKGYSETYEKEYRRKDGTVFPVEVRTFLIRDRDGQPASMWAIVRDITQRKKAEQALHDSETRYRTLFDQSPDAVVILDPETGALLDFNKEACNYLGYTREELSKLTISDLEVIESSEDTNIHFRQIISRGQDRFITRHRTKNGSIRDIEVITRPIQMGGRTLLHGIWHDITESKRAEEELRKSRDELEIKVADRTAQLRTLTSNIIDVEEKERERIGYALHEDLQQTLVALQYKISAIREYASSLAERSTVEAAAGILDKAIALTRSLSAEMMPPVFPGKNLLADLEWLAGDMQERFGLAVRLRAKSEQVEPSDAVREFLVRAVRELLFNVVRHAQIKTADVSIECLDGAGITIQVIDNGKGIAADKLSGHGLGLLKLRERVGHFGGKLRLDSTLGGGTCATLILPMK